MTLLSFAFTLMLAPLQKLSAENGKVLKTSGCLYVEVQASLADQDATLTIKSGSKKRCKNGNGSCTASSETACATS